MLGRTEIQALRHKKLQPKLNVLSARLNAFVVGVLYWTHRSGKGRMYIDVHWRRRYIGEGGTIQYSD